MEDMNLLLLVIGFFSGYIIKTFLTFKTGYTATANLVSKVSNQSLKLLGSIVYKVAFMDQIYQRSISMSQGKEVAKLRRNELNSEFETWKKETIETFRDNYPEDYKWQLEVTDWRSAMNSLTDIYKEEKIPDEI